MRAAVVVPRTVTAHQGIVDLLAVVPPVYGPSPAGCSAEGPATAAAGRHGPQGPPVGPRRPGVLHRAVTEVRQAEPDVPVEQHLVQQRPALALTRAAEGAQLLVVGSHGRGELPGMHLGSVASFCVHHAPCPVVVVRGRDTGR